MHPRSSSPERFESLDLFRFFAAAVVFLGHLSFFSSYGSSLKDEYWVQPIRVGTFAVDFFFALSGFVLSGKKPTGRWMVSRIIRLYPAYFAGLLLGALINFATAGSLLTTNLGVALSVFGLQSLSSEFQLALNPPLWSLSVEFILTPLFLILYLARNSLKLLFFLLIASYTVLLLYSNSVVLRGIPFFILGSIIYRLKRPERSFKFNYTLTFFVLLYLLIGANLYAHMLYSGSDLIIKIVTLALLMYCLLGVNLGRRISYLSNVLGKRSYALYIVHGPLIGVALGFWNPTSTVTFLGYSLTLFVATGLLTEIVYRYVDARAIKASSTFLGRDS